MPGTVTKSSELSQKLVQNNAYPINFRTNPTFLGVQQRAQSPVDFFIRYHFCLTFRTIFPNSMLTMTEQPTVENSLFRNVE